MAKRKAKGEGVQTSPLPPKKGKVLSEKTRPGQAGRIPDDDIVQATVKQYDELLQAACAKQGVEPESLADFKIYPDRIVIILGDYKKITYEYTDLVGFFKKHDALESTLKQ